MNAIDALSPDLRQTFSTLIGERWRMLSHPLGALLGLNRLQTLYEEIRAIGGSVSSALLDRLEIQIRLAEGDLERIPGRGPLVIVANHPYGILEGAVLASLLAQRRPDVKFLANHLLASVPELKDLLIPVDVSGTSSARRANSAGLKRALAHLRAGGALVIFPAGEVSHFQWKDRSIGDSKWHPILSRMVAATGAAVSPVFITGANSAVFQALGLLHPAFRTALLVRELLNKRRAKLEVRIGTAVPTSRLESLSTDADRVDYLRWRTLLLANREAYKPHTSRRFLSRACQVPVRREVVPAISPELLRRDIERLDVSRLVASSGEFEAWLAPADEIPSVLREIGRLRELTFRGAGEGTGRSIDLDEFDSRYLHLFVWHRSRAEVAGAYRLCPTDAQGRLYTETLFHYSRDFLRRLGPAVELGRSFVRKEYQLSATPLLLLWKGIGRYVSLHPHYKVLFGPVSISSQYKLVSRQLIVAFLEKYAWLREGAEMVRARRPFRTLASTTPLPADLDDLSGAVADIEGAGRGVPVLLRQYLKLGGRLLGFNVDPEFSNTLDGLIVVDLTQTEPPLLARYLGRAEASRFLEFHHRKADSNE